MRTKPEILKAVGLDPKSIGERDRIYAAMEGYADQQTATLREQLETAKKALEDIKLGCYGLDNWGDILEIASETLKQLNPIL